MRARTTATATRPVSYTHLDVYKRQYLGHTVIQLYYSFILYVQSFTIYIE